MTTEQKILAIRFRAGNANVTCPTCCRHAAAPYRRHDVYGKVSEGCVDAIHGGHVYGESARWHNRNEAKAIRKSELANLVR